MQVRIKESAKKKLRAATEIARLSRLLQRREGEISQLKKIAATRCDSCGEELASLRAQMEQLARDLPPAARVAKWKRALAILKAGVEGGCFFLSCTRGPHRAQLKCPEANGSPCSPPEGSKAGELWLEALAIKIVPGDL
jgi:recombinational DNA repair ATPase RecF